MNADAIRLGQVLFNLLDNAAKYTDPDGQIWLTAAAEGKWATIRVRDTGVGIPREMLTRIFEMFTQVDRSLDRSQGGLGIGLMLVRSLVEMHGGQVSANSEGPGCGSEFVVRLPLAIGAAALLDRPPARWGRHAGPLRRPAPDFRATCYAAPAGAAAIDRLRHHAVDWDSRAGQASASRSTLPCR